LSYKNKYLELKNLIGGNPSGELSFGSFSDDEEEPPPTCKTVPYLGDSLVPIVIPDNIVGIIKKEDSNPRHIINYENNLSDHPLIHSIDGELLFLSLNVESASAILKNINYNINNLVPPINDANKCGLEKNRNSQYTLSEDDFIKLINFRNHGIFIKLMEKIEEQFNDGIKKIIINLQECYPSLYYYLIKNLKFRGKKCVYTKLFCNNLYEDWSDVVDVKGCEVLPKYWVQRYHVNSCFCSFIIDMDDDHNFEFPDIDIMIRDQGKKMTEQNIGIELDKYQKFTQKEKKSMSLNYRYLNCIPIDTYINRRDILVTNGIMIFYDNLKFINLHKKIEVSPQIAIRNIIEIIHKCYIENIFRIQNIENINTTRHIRQSRNKTGNYDDEALIRMNNSLQTDDELKKSLRDMYEKILGLDYSDNLYITGDFNIRLIDHDRNINSDLLRLRKKQIILNIPQYQFVDYIIKISDLGSVASRGP